MNYWEVIFFYVQLLLSTIYRLFLSIITGDALMHSLQYDPSLFNGLFLIGDRIAKFDDLSNTRLEKKHFFIKHPKLSLIPFSIASSFSLSYLINSVCQYY